MSKREKVKVKKYLVNLAVRYDLEGDEILECVREAFNKETSKCGVLTITCRKKEKDFAVFLFEAQDDLYQFPIPFEVFRLVPRRFTKSLRW